MAEDKNVGLRNIFHCDIDAYEKWKEEWSTVTNMIRSKSAKAGIELSEIEIVEGADDKV